jgi:hypothetical protein
MPSAQTTSISAMMSQATVLPTQVLISSIAYRKRWTFMR